MLLEKLHCFGKKEKENSAALLKYSISNTHVIIDDMLPKKGKRRQHLKLLWFFFLKKQAYLYQ